MPFSVPATLKSMSPRASSSPGCRSGPRSWPSPSSRDQAHRDAGDRRLDRHAGVHQRQGAAADAAHRGRAVGARAPRRRGGSCTGTPPRSGSTAHQRALGQRAVADVAPAGAAHRPGLADRVRAGSCSGACSASARPGRCVSSICSSPSVPSVATDRTWVWPRVKSAEPWVRGRTPTSHVIGRISVGAAAVGPPALLQDVARGPMSFSSALEHLADGLADRSRARRSRATTSLAQLAGGVLAGRLVRVEDRLLEAVAEELGDRLDAASSSTVRRR